MKHLKEDISRLKNAIREKFKQFKQGSLDTELQLEKQYKPLISELRKAPPEVKTEIKQEAEEPEEQETGRDEETFQPNFASSPRSTFSEEDVYGDAGDQSTVSEIIARDPEGASVWASQSFQHPLTKKYMLMMMTDHRKIDNTYGPRFDGNQLLIGSKPMDFDADGNILIEGIRYAGTPGLYELIFKRLPDDMIYNDSDLYAYKHILTKTNAHMRQYMENGTVNRNKAVKYRTVIMNLFPAKKQYGTGFKSTRARDMSYWDDPNELVDRLRLLVTSAEAGNTGHRNEIINIIEELKEARYVKGGGNERFKTLVK